VLPHGGLLVLPAGTPIAYRDLIIALSVRYRLPVVDPFRPFVLDGGLMAYATDQIEMVRMAASYVDRILRGAPNRASRANASSPAPMAELCVGQSSHR